MYGQNPHAGLSHLLVLSRQDENLHLVRGNRQAEESRLWQLSGVANRADVDSLRPFLGKQHRRDLVGGTKAYASWLSICHEMRNGAPAHSNSDSRRVDGTTRTLLSVIPWGAGRAEVTLAYSTPLALQHISPFSNCLMQLVVYTSLSRFTSGVKATMGSSFRVVLAVLVPQRDVQIRRIFSENLPVKMSLTIASQSTVKSWLTECLFI
ncbi:hypothetical protein BKA63DRAFT_593949 [Paraphoma chrysanthemicola]|nr:hypothetical protein BKA63DRAFT_593949 [Paraphoma chrysanthemicola]